MRCDIVAASVAAEGFTVPSSNPTGFGIIKLNSIEGEMGL